MTFKHILLELASLTRTFSVHPCGNCTRHARVYANESERFGTLLCNTIVLQ